MRHEAVCGNELTHFEECACHALADAHAAIQMLAARLRSQGLLNVEDAEILRALTEQDLRKIREIEEHPIAAHLTNSDDSERAAVLVDDRPIHFRPLAED